MVIMVAHPSEYVKMSLMQMGGFYCVYLQAESFFKGD